MSLSHAALVPTSCLGFACSCMSVGPSAWTGSDHLSIYNPESLGEETRRGSDGRSHLWEVGCAMWVERGP